MNGKSQLKERRVHFGLNCSTFEQQRELLTQEKVTFIFTQALQVFSEMYPDLIKDGKFQHDPELHYNNLHICFGEKELFKCLEELLKRKLSGGERTFFKAHVTRSTGQLIVPNNNIYALDVLFSYLPKDVSFIYVGGNDRSPVFITAHELWHLAEYLGGFDQEIKSIGYLHLAAILGSVFGYLAMSAAICNSLVFAEQFNFSQLINHLGYGAAIVLLSVYIEKIFLRLYNKSERETNADIFADKMSKIILTDGEVSGTDN